MPFVLHNGTLLSDDQPILLVSNYGYKWGDGLFETMKVYRGQLLLKTFHFDRLITGIKLLQINLTVTSDELEQSILALCIENGCLDLARVRLAVYRSEENTTGYTIEALPLDPSVMQWNEQGLTVDTYPYARKACDVFANLKTANYLPYVMASRYAEAKGLQESLVLNTYNNICDASKANVFIINDGVVYTPPLDQGCINGVMRRFLLQELKINGWKVKPAELTENMLLHADECFLTNAIQGIRWIRKYRDKEFGFQLTRQIFETVLSTTWR